ncbi:MAG: DUF512 domain-containing protein [Deinococcus sp.]|nr:DUF512 domain-containing protein [Deinococcus sp.]
MRKPAPPARIGAVIPGSPAARSGVAAGDLLYSVSGRRMADILQYRWELAQGQAVLEVGRGEARFSFSVEWEEPGLEFESELFDGIRTCYNNCDFCFVYQMPKGYRESLYIKDDDFRLSYLYGGFITLTNLWPEDRERINREHLSPLYISVHATDASKRRQLLGSKLGARFYQVLAQLPDIEFHTQLVLLPQVNDGAVLEESIAELAARSQVLSIGVVPVGLTEHRQGLVPLRPYEAHEARQVVETSERYRATFLKERGTRLVFPSDEFYLLAGLPLPDAESYEGFSQLENGIGMVRNFLSSKLPRLPRAIPSRRVALVSGTLFAPLLAEAIAPLRAVAGLELEVIAARNSTFGATVTVAGLLAGSDILRAVPQGRFDYVFVSPRCLKEGTDILLDDRSLRDLSAELGAQVQAGPEALGELAAVVLGRPRRSRQAPSGALWEVGSEV